MSGADRSAILDHARFLYDDRPGVACVTSGAWNHAAGRLDDYRQRFFDWPREADRLADYAAGQADAGREV